MSRVPMHAQSSSATDRAAWRRVHDRSPCATLILDGADRATYANPAAARLLRLPSPESVLTAGPLPSLLVIEDVAAWDAARARATGSVAPVQALLRLQTDSDGQRSIAALLAVADELDGEHIHCQLIELPEGTRVTGPVRPPAGDAPPTHRRALPWQTDVDGRFIQVSFDTIVGTGLSSNDVLGRTRDELAVPGSGGESWERCQRLIAAREPFDRLTYRVRPDLAGDSELWLRARGNPRFDTDGAFLGYEGTITDVTAEILAKRRAHQAEQRLDVAIQGMSAGFALYDPDGRLVECNETYRGVQGPNGARLVDLGTSFEELVRTQVNSGWFIVADDDREKWIRRRLEGFGRGGETFQVQRADDGWHQARDHHCPDGSVIVLLTDITELKAQEAALAESERRFRDYVASTGDWLWETDPEHRFTFISQRFTQITGVPAEKVVGLSRLELAGENATGRVWEQHLADLEAHRPFRDFVYRSNADDRTVRYFKVSGVPLLDDAGAFTGYRGTGVECTADVQARTLQERHLDAIEAFSGAYSLYDADDRLVEWNSTWVHFAHPRTRPVIHRGMRFEDLVRANVENGWFPDAKDDPEGWIAWRLRVHQECGEPMELRGYDGRWYMMRERRTPEGGVMQTAFDVSELKQREDELRESEERLRTFAETAADWFFETDENLHLRFLSPRYERLTGVDPGTLEGEPFESLLRPGDDEGAAPRRRCIGAMRAREPLDDLEVEGNAPNGRTLVHSISAVPVFAPDGSFRGYRGSGRDVTEARNLATQLAYQASHDELTGLVNRRELERRLQRAIDNARNTGATHALCFLDLDQFKLVNDTCGHSAGDELLRQLGESLQSRVRGRDTLARLGGDEFALLLEHCSLEQAEAIAGSLRRAIETFEFSWEGRKFRLGASIGLVPVSSALSGSTEALRAADTACYLAKEQGRNRVHVYSAGDMDVEQREGEMNWVSRITTALAEDRLTLFAQPIVPAHGDGTQRVPRCYELLLRLTEHDGTLVPPGAFLPAAERYGLAGHIDRWVVRNALYFLEKHERTLPPDLRFAINLSGQSIADPEFTRSLGQVIEEQRVAPERLCFEVTETAAVGNIERAREFMRTVQALGCSFALDDFGTGLSSFAYLRELPVDYIKIDGSFVRGIADDPVSLSMVRSIRDIGHVLGKQTIAEYVSSEAEADLLAELGIDYVQGFGIGHPMPVDEILHVSVTAATSGAGG